MTRMWITLIITLTMRVSDVFSCLFPRTTTEYADDSISRRKAYHQARRPFSIRTETRAPNRPTLIITINNLKPLTHQPLRIFSIYTRYQYPPPSPATTLLLRWRILAPDQCGTEAPYHISLRSHHQLQATRSHDIALSLERIYHLHWLYNSGTKANRPLLLPFTLSSSPCFNRLVDWSLV